MIEIRGKYNIAKVFLDTIEEKTYAQLLELCNQEFVTGSQIRIMPDTHVGSGCTIGTTMTITNKVVPSHVGVDIGCGVYVGKIDTETIDFAKLDQVIRKNVPLGFDVRQKPHRFASKIDLSLYPVRLKNVDHLKLSIGSLGGGNHFIEVAQDPSGKYYLLIHTGSRNLGTQVAKFYQQLAYDILDDNRKMVEETITQLKREGREAEIQETITKIKMPKVNRDFAYLEGVYLESYLKNMTIAQEFAELNRQAIADVICRGMNWKIEEFFSTVHNYIEDGMLRKGAVSAKDGEQLIIPINMRDGSILAIGKGNEEWNCSAPHGAGRVMSRREAKDTLNLDEFVKTMQDVYTTSVCSATLDEAPDAYKPIHLIANAISDTVDIISIIKPVYNIKGGAEQ